MMQVRHTILRTEHGAVDTGGRARRTIRSSIAESLVLSMVALPFSATALAQVVHLPAASYSAELRCPDRDRPVLPRPPLRKEEAYMLPSNEELAGLQLRGEAHSQDIYLGAWRRTDPAIPFSIGFWGDSHVASAHFPEEMMRVLGLTRDRVRPTFIPPTMDRSGVRLPIQKYCQSAGWSYDYAYTSGQAGAEYAKGLVNLKSNVPNSYLWVDFRLQPQVSSLRSLDVLYVPPKRGERTLVGIIADNGAEQLVELNADDDGVIQLRAERLVSTIKLRLILGSFSLQGFVPHYAGKPALYLDTLGIPGATVRGWKAVNTDYLKTRNNDASYDLVILEYGTNEGNDQNLDPEKYAADLRASLKNLRRVYPESLCVLIGPTDRGVLVKSSTAVEYQRATPPPESFFHYSRIHQRISNIQATIGKEFSCSFWSWQDAMGGPGAAYMWMRHSPVLIARDLIHLTVPGYQLSARKFVSDTRLQDYVRN